MELEILKDIINKKRKIVILGESGSGKSELAINLAVKLKRMTEKEIHFFDMDQTKPIYRSRDAKSTLIEHDIIFHSPQQFLDAPIVPHGVNETLRDSENIAILDVGGNIVGALTMGQYSELLRDEDTEVFYTINYYRCFSDTKEKIKYTMEEIQEACSLRNTKILSNPNLGDETTLEDILYGNKKLNEIVNELGYKVYMTLVSNWIEDDLLVNLPNEIFKIKPYILYP